MAPPHVGSLARDECDFMARPDQAEAVPWSYRGAYLVAKGEVAVNFGRSRCPNFHLDCISTKSQIS